MLWPRLGQRHFEHTSRRRFRISGPDTSQGFARALRPRRSARHVAARPLQPHCGGARTLGACGSVRHRRHVRKVVPKGGGRVLRDAGLIFPGAFDEFVTSSSGTATGRASLYRRAIIAGVIRRRRDCGILGAGATIESGCIERGIGGVPYCHIPHCPARRATAAASLAPSRNRRCARLTLQGLFRLIVASPP